ncbi:MAG: 16S rRNA (cytosine(1402)-N(4))-methyltransferase RsmH [Candidatus Omnitrophica bacterium]|nr:16S rRNA (cytosine(1402)-N(4))-methyltransferase RsmH [Candidatus Omnitrophota bacterium]
MFHNPVLLKETVDLLRPKPGALAVDGTLGNGGHGAALLQRIGAQGKLIGLDQDEEAIQRCRQRFKDSPNVLLYQENFKNLGFILDSLNISQVDVVILDVGFSSYQLEKSERGFSFDKPGPLDMRMDRRGEIKARDLVNDLSKEELEKIFREYGEEHRAARFAELIVKERSQHPIETTDQLADVILKSVLGKFPAKKGSRPPWARHHPATRVFQALRIAVNDELGVLKEGLPAIWKRIGPGGRLGVISFHSLEDRIVKWQFRDWTKAGEGRLVNKKPVIPAREEIIANSRSRSAKLRVIEKI